VNLYAESSAVLAWLLNETIHLASLLVARSAVVGIRLLSLDERVRQAAKRLGIAVEPG